MVFIVCYLNHCDTGSVVVNALYTVMLSTCFAVECHKRKKGGLAGDVMGFLLFFPSLVHSTD